MAKPTGGWSAWTHNEMVEYLMTGGKLKIRFRCKDGHRGWTKQLGANIDTAIRQHLREMAKGTSVDSM